MNKSEDFVNYKIVSIILAALLIIFIIIGIMTYQKQEIREKGIIEGQQNAINLLLESLDENGQATIQTPQGNVTVVKSRYIDLAQKLLIQEIFSSVQNQGSVTLTLNTTQLTLIPQ